MWTISSAEIRRIWKTSEAQVAKARSSSSLLGHYLRSSRQRLQLQPGGLLGRNGKGLWLGKRAAEQNPFVTVQETDAEPGKKMTRAAQKLAGKVLWVSGSFLEHW